MTLLMVTVVAPCALGFAGSGDGIRRFARLGDAHEQRVLIEHRLAIAELRTIIDFNREAGHVFDHILADQGGMP